jgi:hypothetical protein
MFTQFNSKRTRVQNAKFSPASPAHVAPAAKPHVLERVIAIAPAPLLPGEKDADYASLANRIVDAAKPQDTIEELLTRDVIDLSWDILRLRRVKTGILKASMNIGVDEVLKALTHGPESSLLYRKELGKKWLAGDKNARKEVEAVLDKAGLSIDEVTAKTVESKLDSFERLDRMSARAEARGNKALDVISRHREALGSAVRRSIEETEDVEFRSVEDGGATARAQP